MLNQITFNQAAQKFQKGEDITVFKRCKNQNGEYYYKKYFLSEILDELQFFEDAEDKPEKKAKIDIDKLRALVEANWSIDDLADEFDVSRTTISRYIKKL